jgi:hypothetical protein
VLDCGLSMVETLKFNLIFRVVVIEIL